MVEWGNYAEAYKAIHDKLEEIKANIYDLLAVVFNVDEVDYNWNSDGTLNTEVYKKDGDNILTLTYTWNADGTLNKVVRT